MGELVEVHEHRIQSEEDAFIELEIINRELDELTTKH